MPRIPLADAPSQNIAGARMPYADAGAMAAPARALVGLGNQLSQVAEQWQADQKRMGEFKMRLAMERLNTDQTIAYKTDYDNSAPDGSDFPIIREKNFIDAYKKVRSEITDPELAAQADLLAEKMRGDFLVKSVADADGKRTNFVTIETDKGVTDAVKTGQIKDRKSAETYFDNVIKPKIDLAITDPVKREELYRAFGKRMLDELQIADPSSIMPQRFTGERVVDAVSLVESGNNPDAVSPAGAIGLMQVMPGTADEIAKELGDQTYFSLPPSQRIEYLKNAAVSKRYGSYYLNKQLSRYGGDLEAALIAYNAGPGNADKWLAAGRDYSALPKPQETLPYVQKIMGILGTQANGGQPITASPARFTGSMWDYVGADELRAAQSGASTSIKERLDLGIENGTVSLSDIERANLNDGDTASLISKWKVANKDAIDVGQFDVSLRENPGQIVPGTETDAVAEKWYKTASGGDPSALMSDDPEVAGRAASAMTFMFTQAGILPKSGMNSIDGMIRTGNPDKIEAAFSLLDGFERANPRAFEREVPEYLRRDLDKWQSSREYRSKEEFASDLLEASDPTKAKVREVLETRAQDILKKDFSDVSSVVKVFDNGWIFSTATEPMGKADPTTRQLIPDVVAGEAMRIDFNREFTQAYIDTGGNQRQALEIAQKRLARVWGASKFGGSDTSIMRHPPEKYYPAIDINSDGNPTQDWMKDLLEQELEGQGYHVKDRAPSGVVGDTGSQGTWGYRLLTTSQTEADISNPRLKGVRGPAYDIYLYNRDTGEELILPNFYFDPKKVQEQSDNSFSIRRELFNQVQTLRDAPEGFDIRQLMDDPFGNKPPSSADLERDKLNNLQDIYTPGLELYVSRNPSNDRWYLIPSTINGKKIEAGDAAKVFDRSYWSDLPSFGTEEEAKSAANKISSGDAQQTFQWPATGNVISGFGDKGNGQKNDGINIEMPEGSPVAAARDGVVAYVGDELKGYGNLILIRHEDGYVTAYAHNSKLNVKKGDTVKAGDIIASSGKTGSVQVPQLHFEVRKGAEAIDPMKFLKSQ